MYLKRNTSLMLIDLTLGITIDRDINKTVLKIQ